MALSLETNLPRNKNGNYWVITGVVMNFELNTTVINYALWKDESEHQNKYDAVEGFQTKLEKQENTEALQELISGATNPKSLAYNHLKTKVKYPVDFSLAEDV